MSEERSINPTRVLVGDFKIIAREGGFTLSEIYSVTERYKSFGAIIFRSPTLARDVAQLLSLSFKDDVTGGSIGFKLGDIGYAEVRGGKDGLCKLFRWDEEEKQTSQPFLIANSR